MPGRGHREVQIPEDGEGNSLLDTFESLDEQSVPDKALDNEETRRMILALVDSLPDAQRQCVLMFYYGELGNQIPARDPDARVCGHLRTLPYCGRLDRRQRLGLGTRHHYRRRRGRAGRISAAHAVPAPSDAGYHLRFDHGAA